MLLNKKLTPVALATALAAGSMAAPGIASAEVSASLNISNMYLWRGQNLTPDGPAFSGSIDYAADSGLYTGIWGTNETAGTEFDLYVGYGGEAGSVSYDISYWQYMYPEDGGTGPATGLSDTNLSEIIIGLGVADFGATFYLSDETQGGSDYIYYTLDYTINDYNILFGGWSFDKAGNEEYTHITATYAYNDNLSFGLSIAQEDTVGGIEEDPLFLVSYSIPVE